MKYQHSLNSNEVFEYPLGKIVCVGRNYADHARELNNPIPSEPILFIKPATAAVAMAESFRVPSDKGACHFETEMAVLIGQTLTNACHAEAKVAVAGVGLAFDLTLRELQQKLKDKGHPWEKAKAFDGSCPLSPFVKPEAVADLQNLQLRLTRNGELKQDGNTGQMLTGVVDLLVYMSRFFTLEPGDVVLTGTPAGVGPIQAGDVLRAELVGLLSLETHVTS